MPTRQADDHRGLLGGAPAKVRVTVLSGPRDPGIRTRVANTRAQVVRTVTAIAVLAAVAAALVSAALVSVAWLGGRDGAARREDGQARAPGPAGVAAAYGYPLQCLAVTIAPHDPGYARADFNHGVPCGRYTGDPTAIFHRVDGVWVRALDSASYSCPVASLPKRVQADLAVCP
jgi:hypothetical protein